jgi:hypothetical protein
MKNIYKNNLLKKASVAIALAFGTLSVNAQTTVIDFETFTLSPNSAYSQTTSTGFQTPEASFNYVYNFNFWLGGFAYTNVKDSSTAGSANMYGVRAYSGHTNSAMYTVGQNKGVIKLSAPQSTVNGFYITNTTYAYKSIKSGDQFTRKFGDTTGAGSGTSIAQGSYPDYFKLTVRGYKNGVLKTDSATLLLADYTFTNNALDFVLDKWTFVNTANLGEVDSLKFFMRSTDSGQYGMNTPGFFAIDDISVSKPNIATGIQQNSIFQLVTVSPNPSSSLMTVNTPWATDVKTSLRIYDIAGKTVWGQEITETTTGVDVSTLENGVYFLELSSADQKATTKIIKN